MGSAKLCLGILAVFFLTCGIAVADVSPSEIAGKAGDHAAITITEDFEIGQIEAYGGNGPVPLDTNGVPVLTGMQKLPVLGLHQLANPSGEGPLIAAPMNPPFFGKGRLGVTPAGPTGIPRAQFYLDMPIQGNFIRRPLFTTHPPMEAELYNNVGKEVAIYSICDFCEIPQGGSDPSPSRATRVDKILPYEKMPGVEEGILKFTPWPVVPFADPFDGIWQLETEDGMIYTLNYLTGDAPPSITNGGWDIAIKEFMEHNIGKKVRANGVFVKTVALIGQGPVPDFYLIGIESVPQRSAVVVLGLIEDMDNLALVITPKDPMVGGGRRLLRQIPVAINPFDQVSELKDAIDELRTGSDALKRGLEIIKAQQVAQDRRLYGHDNVIGLIQTGLGKLNTKIISLETKVASLDMLVKKEVASIKDKIAKIKLDIKEIWDYIRKPRKLF